MKLTLLLTGLMLVGSDYGQYKVYTPNRIVTADSNGFPFANYLHVDTVGTPISQKILSIDSVGFIRVERQYENKIFVDTVQIVWDSLGFLKITPATRIAFRRETFWIRFREHYSWRFWNIDVNTFYNYDSVWYVRNNERWFVKPLMEIK
jgi:hypothetical protein